jgi:ATP-dependent DNA ligase
MSARIEQAAAKAKRKPRGLAGLPVPVSTLPMEAKSAAELPDGPGWQFEPKWDGFRCLAFRAGDEIELRSKSGKPLARYFPDVAALLLGLPEERFVLDGELVVPAGEGLSFEALQLRLHPAASRVQKLAAAQPASLILFDCLMDRRGAALLDAPLTARRAALEDAFARFGGEPRLQLSPATRDRTAALRWLGEAGGVVDGVVAKRLDGPYLSGERAMAKVKRLRTADCVVGGFRYLQAKPEVGSLLLGLYGEDGLLHHVGHTSTIPAAERAKLTRRLEKLRGGPGFTGSAPGGPSRWDGERTTEWEPLKPELVVEVRYDHVSEGRFRHGTSLVRWRPDKSPAQCRFDQIEPPHGGLDAMMGR